MYSIIARYKGNPTLVKEIKSPDRALTLFMEEAKNLLERTRSELECERSIESIKEAYERPLVCEYKIFNNGRIAHVIDPFNTLLSFGFDIILTDLDGEERRSEEEGNIDDLWGFTIGIDYLSIVPDPALEDKDSLESIANMIKQELPPVFCANGNLNTDKYRRKEVELLAYLKGLREVDTLTEQDVDKYHELLKLIMKR